MLFFVRFGYAYNHTISVAKVRVLSLGSVYTFHHQLKMSSKNMTSYFQKREAHACTSFVIDLRRSRSISFKKCWWNITFEVNI